MAKYFSIIYEGEYDDPPLKYDCCESFPYRTRYYLHAKSKILQPKIGDLYYVTEGKTAFELDKTLCLEKFWEKRPAGKIIKRNGMAFLMPEVEDDKKDQAL